jgi:activator of 2-hydroxyglutaryl-CoA dehydratase
MDIPWYGYIAIVGVIGWAAMVIIGATGYGRSKAGQSKANDVMEENIATNKAVLAKLDSIENRLGVVEKTLTDIQ